MEEEEEEEGGGGFYLYSGDTVEVPRAPAVTFNKCNKFQSGRDLKVGRDCSLTESLSLSLSRSLSRSRSRTRSLFVSLSLSLFLPPSLFPLSEGTQTSTWAHACASTRVHL